MITLYTFPFNFRKTYESVFENSYVFLSRKKATLQNNITGIQFMWTGAAYVKEDDLCTPSQRLFHLGSDCLKSY